MSGATTGQFDEHNVNEEKDHRSLSLSGGERPPVKPSKMLRARTHLNIPGMLVMVEGASSPVGSTPEEGEPVEEGTCSRLQVWFGMPLILQIRATFTGGRTSRPNAGDPSPTTEIFLLTICDPVLKEISIPPLGSGVDRLRKEESINLIHL